MGFGCFLRFWQAAGVLGVLSIVVYCSRPGEFWSSERRCSGFVVKLMLIWGWCMIFFFFVKSAVYL